jgi:hypothetical protein
MAISKATTLAHGGMKRPRSVRFCNTVKHVLDARRVEHEEVKATWLSKAELATIKHELRTDITSFLNGQVQAMESNTACWRGLEVYTQRNNKYQAHRRERRAFLVTGVKDLQMRLKAEGLPTENSIRKLVAISTKQAVQEAHNLAQQDALAASQIYLETFLAPSSAFDKLDSVVADMPLGVATEDLFAANHQQLVTARTA